MGETYTKEVFTVRLKFTLTGHPAFYLTRLVGVPDGLLPVHELMTDEAGPGFLQLEGGMGEVKGGAALGESQEVHPHPVVSGSHRRFQRWSGRRRWVVSRGRLEAWEHRGHEMQRRDEYLPNPRHRLQPRSCCGPGFLARHTGPGSLALRRLWIRVHRQHLQPDGLNSLFLLQSHCHC